MVRKAEIRKKRYEKGIHPEAIGKRIAQVKDIMVDQETVYLGQITLVEEKAKAIVEAAGVPVHQVAQYVNVARQCYRLAKDFSPPTRDNEAYAVLQHWNRRGLQPELLRLVCVAGGCDPAAPDIPVVTGTLNDLEDVEIVLPEECEVLHYDAATLKWRNVHLDHGALAGLGDDDHLQYALTTKARPSPWVAAADLAARSIADLGTRDHHLLAGLGDDDHTQYVLRNILTTHGDFFFRDATGVARFAPGPAGQFLQTQGPGADPVWATPVAAVPSGIICMWHGLIANIPAGWVLCDGNNGTPNLLSRFVESVPNAGTNPGATGGATSKTTSGHQHKAPLAQSGNVIRGAGADPWGSSGGFTSTNYVNLVSGAVADTYSLDSSGTDTIADIRPLYYDIAFIMKT